MLAELLEKFEDVFTPLTGKEKEDRSVDWKVYFHKTVRGTAKGVVQSVPLGDRFGISKGRLLHTLEVKALNRRDAFYNALEAFGYDSRKGQSLSDYTPSSDFPRVLIWQAYNGKYKFYVTIVQLTPWNESLVSEKFEDIFKPADEAEIESRIPEGAVVLLHDIYYDPDSDGFLLRGRGSRLTYNIARKGEIMLPTSGKGSSCDPYNWVNLVGNHYVDLEPEWYTPYIRKFNESFEDLFKPADKEEVDRRHQEIIQQFVKKGMKLIGSGDVFKLRRSSKSKRSEYDVVAKSEIFVSSEWTNSPFPTIIYQDSTKGNKLFGAVWGLYDFYKTLKDGFWCPAYTPHWVTKNMNRVVERLANEH